MSALAVRNEDGLLDNSSVAADPIFPKLLCVDDDPNVPASMVRSLRPYRVDVLCAYHGMQGIWLATTEKPNVIVTDLAMPWTCGEELIETLLNHPATRAIPLIVLTGKADPQITAQLKSRGVVEVFQKPTPFEELFEALSGYIDFLLRPTTRALRPNLARPVTPCSDEVRARSQSPLNVRPRKEE